jgi:uncharacterized protein (TIGR03435 family)
VKPSSNVTAEPASMVMPGGRYVATNVTLRQLLRTAYGVQESQVVGGPSWLDSERFDVNAIANRDIPTIVFRDRFRPMLQSVLRDRFSIRVHRATKELGAYELLIARRDGMLGPRLHASSDECIQSLALRRAGKLVPPPTGAVLACGAWYSQPDHLEARGVELGRLVEGLAPLVERVVVDHTKLVGLFDWDLRWLPAADSSTDLPTSIYTALAEQLGLKLDSRRLPVDVIVVDHVERLKAN